MLAFMCVFVFVLLVSSIIALASASASASASALTNNSNDIETNNSNDEGEAVSAPPLSDAMVDFRATAREFRHNIQIAQALVEKERNEVM